MTISALLAVAIVGSWLVVWLRSRRALVDLPVMGDTSFLAPWKVAGGLAGPPDKLSQEGYEKYREGSYQFATANGWEVCICNDTLVKELAQLPEEIMSLYAFNDAQFQSEYTSPGFADSGVNLPVQLLSKALAWARVRGSADKDIYFAGLVEDLECGIDQKIGLSAADWIQLNCFQLGTHLLLGLITHVLIGTPLCRDPRAIDLFSRYGASVPVSGRRIGYFPRFLRPLVAPYFEAPRLSKELDAMLLQLIADRRTSDLKEPQTIIDWLCRWIQTDPSGIYGDIHIAQSLVSVVFGSVHSAGTVLASCLYELSRRPEYIEPLHEEVRRALEEHNGWCKEAIESMVQVDSFIKECHRHRPIAPVALTRLAKSNHTFSTGLFIPRGTVLHVPNTPHLMDERYYPKSDEFDGFRFYRQGRQTNSPDDFKITGSSPANRQFGAGRHTCPGKQLAADSLRLGMAYILMHFNVAGDGRLEPLDSTLQANLKLRRRNPTKAN
ncbi:Cytochrome monooxygenase atmQ [Penicillium odoratum]|uniref:Cytochrome monooxygenase atmQ n=1 Tax=Penicillium odoratum TaxID=1167516 RepID=UPI002546E949|nr:Cytochrome monooxygenase atmQ [Penicillium odoratum]KAJ5751608.1 Cytochrome monooxygenase atmQ [Penicillium odoratum]